MTRPTRLIDLRCDWPLQYATETTVFDPALYPETRARLGQAEGYLRGASASVLACSRKAEDWARQADPWAALGALIARVEAEFPGRLLIGPDDLARWAVDGDGLCWALIGVAGFDALIRTTADLDRLPGLFARGVRVFQPVQAASGLLAGSASPGDDRRLTDLGRAFLDVLSAVAEVSGPRPLLDLSHLNPASMADVLAWFEADADRPRGLAPFYGHGAPAHAGFDVPRAITADNLARLRALGGVIGFRVGPPFFRTPDELQAGLEAVAAIPFRGRIGPEGIALGTGFLGVDEVLPALGAVDGVVAWVQSRFEPETAAAILAGNARALVAFATGSGTGGPSSC